MYRFCLDNLVLNSEAFTEDDHYDVRDLTLTVENEDEYWSSYYQEVEDLYEDVLMDENPNDENHDGTELEEPMATTCSLSTPIFEGSMTTLGVSLYSIVSFAVKNALR